MKSWRDYDPEELERQYNARASVADFDAEIARYRELSEACYASRPVIRDLAFGDAPTERIDYFPAGANAPVLIFVHGGYWRLLGRSDSAFMAAALADHGISTAVVEYTLAPEVSLDQIVAETHRAVAWIYANISTHGGDPERLFICGSSAGAQLAAMALTTGWTEELGNPNMPLRGGLLLSGLYDLEPLRHCQPNQWLNLDAAGALRNSPQHLTFDQGPEFSIHWGGAETDEFKRQSLDFLRKLKSAGLNASGSEIEDRNHFNIVTDLADPSRELFKTLISMIESPLRASGHPTHTGEPLQSCTQPSGG